MRNKLRHLQCINGVYRYRRRWPTDVKPLAKGEFFIRHMRTGDLSEAEAQRPVCDLEFNAAVRKLRQSVDSKPRQITEAEAFHLAAEWFAEAKAHTEHVAMRPRKDEKHDEAIEEAVEQTLEARSEVSSASPPAVRIAGEIMAERGIKAQPEGPGYSTLVNLIARSRVELSKFYEQALVGNYAYAPADELVAKLVAGISDKPKRTVADLIEAYKADKAAGWSKSTAISYEPVFRLLRDTLGSTRDIASLDREDGRRLFDMVQGLPRNLGKLKAVTGLPVPEAVEKARKLGLPVISAKSANDSYLAFIGSIFKWAVDEHWLTRSPVKGLRVSDDTASWEKRDPFTVDQINKLFAGAPWSTEEARAKATPVKLWTPLIALFQGMRRGEIVQLRLSDIGEVDGVPVIYVRPGEDKTVKTKAGIRRLPVHPELIRLGFLRYVASQREAGAAQLFDGEAPNKRGQWGDPVSDWFVRLLAARGIKGTKLGLHSFRHNFVDRLREAELDETARGKALIGHSRKGVTADYGAGELPLRSLLEALEAVTYPELVLPDPLA